MVIDPKSVARMGVCRDCRDVIGPFSRLDARGGDPEPLVHRGTCPRHRSSEPEPTWPRFDFNRHVDLCYCCGTVPLRTGSRWSVWFCDPCKAQVGLLNGRHGRCIVPIGRHSVHWGHLLPVAKLDDTLAVEGFLASARVQGRVTQILRDWNYEVVARNLTAIEAGDRPCVPIVDYSRAVRLQVDPMDRFREMCSYLDGRGRSELNGERAEHE